MPIYEYRCATCRTDFDISQSFSDDPLTTCPVEGGPKECTAPGKGEVKKLFSAVGISFKGSGFYKNDSRTSSAAAAKSSSNGSSDSAGKTSDSSKSDSSKGGNSKSDGSASSGSKSESSTS